MNIEQRAMIVHALTGGNHDGTVYRNYYAADPRGTDDPNWQELQSEGLARRGRTMEGGLILWHVTEKGAQAVGLTLK